MQAANPENQIATLRAQGGYARLARWGLCRVSGKDASTFLQARVSNDVAALKPGQGQANALLDRKAHLLASFSVHKLEGEFWICAENEQIGCILKELETYHFRESVEFADESAKYEVFLVCGIKCGALFADGTVPPLSAYGIKNGVCFGFPLKIIARSITGEPGFFLIVDRQDGLEFFKRLSAQADSLGLALLDPLSLNVARLEAGIGEFGQDIGPENLIFETGLEGTAISYSKGCFCGQEVIARVKAQGAPRRRLSGLVLDGDWTDNLPLDVPIFWQKKEIGQLKSNLYSPTLSRPIALAYMFSEYRVPGQTHQVEIAGRQFNASVQVLPFYQRKDGKEKALGLYQEALAAFAADEDDLAYRMLNEAILLDPDCLDAYEALGVLYARKGKLDSAISLMQRLAELDPSSIMAHANLSLYYANKGLKEEAENEKALAMTAQMQKISQELTDEKLQAEAKAKEEERRTRMSMFSQVLEIDPEDQLANYGLGSIYVELKDFTQAIAHLQKSIAAKPDHTVSYLALSLAFEGAGKTDEARETLKKGIEVAAQKGDMMPLEQMQKKQAELALR